MHTHPSLRSSISRWSANLVWGTTMVCLLHGCSQADQPAQQPPPQAAPPPAAQTTPDKQILDSHDDPVVVDNAHVGVTRESKPKPPQNKGGKEWSISEMDRFTHLQYWTKDKQNVQHGPTTIAVDNNVKTFYFDLVEDKDDETGPNSRVFEIRQVPAGGAHDDVRVESKAADLEFEAQGNDLKDKTKKLHIGQIRYGTNKFLCFAETGAPLTRKCNSWTRLPKEVRVELCANKECEQLSREKAPVPR